MTPTFRQATLIEVSTVPSLAFSALRNDGMSAGWQKFHIYSRVPTLRFWQACRDAEDLLLQKQ